MRATPDEPGPTPVRVTALVVSWNAVDDLPACLDSLLAQEHDDLEIVVVDNASSDGSADVVVGHERDGRVRLVRNPVNRGFAGGVNDGLAASDGDAVLLCNPDVVARPDLVGRLVAALAERPRVAAVQPKLLRPAPGPDGRPVIDTTGHEASVTRLFANRGEGEPDDGRWDEPGEVFGVSGACALHRRAALEDVALASGQVLDEDLFAYFEDVDLDWRLRRRGWTAWYEPAAVAVHERGGAGPRRTVLVERLNFRNRLLVVAANDHLPSLVRAAPAVLLTTLLKTVDLAVTAPRALLGALADLVRLGPPVAAKRRRVDATAVVPAEAVVAGWFGGFDYGRWVRMWWRRIRGDVAGHARD